MPPRCGQPDAATAAVSNFASRAASNREQRQVKDRASVRIKRSQVRGGNPRVEADQIMDRGDGFAELGDQNGVGAGDGKIDVVVGGSATGELLQRAQNVGV